MSEYQPVDLSKKKSEALIVHCADPRFQKAYGAVIDGLDVYYDLMERAGASKGLVEDEGAIVELQMLHDLHNFSEVHILDHVDCGAYGAVEDEAAAHANYLKMASVLIKRAVPQLEVVPHLLGQKEEVTLQI